MSDNPPAPATPQRGVVDSPSPPPERAAVWIVGMILASLTYLTATSADSKLFSYALLAVIAFVLLIVAYIVFMSLADD